MIVLGLNAFHADAAAALVIDGVVVAAAEEEVDSTPMEGVDNQALDDIRESIAELRFYRSHVFKI